MTAKSHLTKIFAEHPTPYSLIYIWMVLDPEPRTYDVRR
jgi:hypothetical protein